MTVTVILVIVSLNVNNLERILKMTENDKEIANNKDANSNQIVKIPSNKWFADFFKVTPKPLVKVPRIKFKITLWGDFRCY